MGATVLQRLPTSVNPDEPQSMHFNSWLQLLFWLAPLVDYTWDSLLRLTIGFYFVAALTGLCGAAVLVGA